MSRIKVGDVVDYHSVIGREITSRNHVVQQVFLDYSGHKVARISGKSGYVAVDALSLTMEDNKARFGCHRFFWDICHYCEIDHDETVCDCAANLKAQGKRREDCGFWREVK